MAFGGRGVNPAGSNDPIAVLLAHLVEGHLLRYASGLAAASGTSLPHRSNGRVSSQGAAGLVVPAAAAAGAAEAVAADTTGRPEGMIFQGRATAHRDRTRRWHSRRDVDDDDDGDGDGDDATAITVSRGNPHESTHSVVYYFSFPLVSYPIFSFLSSSSTASLRSLVAPRCRSADLPGRSRPIWHSSGGHRSREREVSFLEVHDGSRLGRYTRDGLDAGFATRMDSGSSRDDVTAARGDVDVNRGRDARNHDDRKNRTRWMFLKNELEKLDIQVTRFSSDDILRRLNRLQILNEINTDLRSTFRFPREENNRLEISSDAVLKFDEFKMIKIRHFTDEEKNNEEEDNDNIIQEQNNDIC
ncbi:hypothetical protein ALC57_00723 [Trachymyrmex cornetzi]|uniref:Uncharacterized protein n=1 Tax=Trachymyrmex cornetzi TaxID=471704 RepID=A0A151JRS0_9HYME|nr:hypothetical protein ALC57_00723 [Trachymyrmex cornetzi]